MSEIQKGLLFFIGFAVVFLLTIFMFTGVQIKLIPQDAYTKMETEKALQGVGNYVLMLNGRLEAVEKRLKILTPTPKKDN